MREWTYQYRPSFRNAIFYPLTWDEFLGRQPILIHKADISAIHFKFNKMSLRLQKNGVECELLLNKDESPATEIINDNQDKIVPPSSPFPPALLRNIGAVAFAFLFSAVIYAGTSLWLKSGGLEFFSTSSCQEACPSLMGLGLITALGTLLFHPLGFGLLAVAADELLQRYWRDYSGRHLVKFGCAILILLSLMGASVVPSMTAMRTVQGFVASVHSLSTDRTPDFSYLPQSQTVDLSSQSSSTE